jgi:2-polyprenyl-3-methyl-5-hydroxy-6-metoxy-1,4-benzoquinol methylase
VSKYDHYVGCDIAAPESPQTNMRFETIDFNRESVADRFTGEEFDLIFCGEVIEHLFSPDALMADIRRLLSPEGIVILSTPNLAYWVNRLLLLFGLSPLFLENSSRRKLGRKFRFLGAGNSTEGHIRLFTYRALREFVRMNGFEILRTIAAPIWPLTVDRVLCRVVPQLAPDIILLLARTKSPN